MQKREEVKTKRRRKSGNKTSYRLFMSNNLTLPSPIKDQSGLTQVLGNLLRLASTNLFLLCFPNVSKLIGSLDLFLPSLRQRRCYFFFIPRSQPPEAR